MWNCVFSASLYGQLSLKEFMSKQALMCIGMWLFVSGIYLGKVNGIKEASEDTDLLKFKLSQCNEVLRGGK